VDGRPNDAQREAFDRAMAYLKTSETARALIEALQNSGQVLWIRFNRGHDTSFCYRDNVIHWAPRSGLVLGDERYVQSAALGLAHEMGHAFQRLELGMMGFHNWAVTAREADNLSRFETPIAMELGEFTRRNFDDASRTLRMDNSTDWGIRSVTRVIPIPLPINLRNAPGSPVGIRIATIRSWTYESLNPWRP